MDWLVVLLSIVAALVLILTILVSDRFKRPAVVVPMIIAIVIGCIVSIIYLPEIVFPNAIRGEVKEIVLYMDKNDQLRAWILTDDSSYGTDENGNTVSYFDKINNYLYDPTTETVIKRIVTKMDDVPRYRVFHENNRIWLVVQNQRTPAHVNQIMVYDATTGEILFNERSFLKKFPKLEGRIIATGIKNEKNPLVFEIQTEDAQQSFYNVDDDILTSSFQKQSLSENSESFERERILEATIASLCPSEACETIDSADSPLGSAQRELAELKSRLKFASILSFAAENESPRRRKLYKLKVRTEFLPEVSAHIAGYQYVPEEAQRYYISSLIESQEKLSDDVYLDGEIIFQDTEKVIFTQNHVGNEQSVTNMDLNGKVRWTQKRSFSSAAAINGVVILTSKDNDALSALDMTTGLVSWKAKL